MQRMEQTHSYLALQDDIAEVDPGIVVRPIALHWGTLISLERQGQSTGWKLYLRDDNTYRLSHPKSASLPDVDIHANDMVELRDYVLHFVNRGWI